MRGAPHIVVKEATADRWTDFETLMGPKGGAGGGWCMLWRCSKKDFDAAKGAGNKQAIQARFSAHRKRGVSIALLRAAETFVKSCGGQTMEGYPVDPDNPAYPPVYAWVGLAKGFKEVIRRSPTRPIMRRTVL